MSSYQGDIGAITSTGVNRTEGATSSAKKKTDNSLDMTDFLTLMVAQFQNQSIDNAADTSDMLNQLVQMTVVQAITNITDATVMQYAGSLVGKEVTVADVDASGDFVQITGTVQATGTYGGQQVLYVNDKRYFLNEILSVGKLPDNAISGGEEDKKPEKPGETDPETPPVDKPEGDTEGGTENPSGGAEGEDNAVG